jgi:hypothetical protein
MSMCRIKGGLALHRMRPSWGNTHASAVIGVDDLTHGFRAGGLIVRRIAPFTDNATPELNRRGVARQFRDLPRAAEALSQHEHRPTPQRTVTMRSKHEELRHVRRAGAKSADLRGGRKMSFLMDVC